MNRYRLFGSIAIALLVAMMATFVASAQSSEDLKQVKLKIGVSGSVEKNKIETITNAFKGVSESEFNIPEKTLTVKYNADEINTEMLMHLLKVVGYDSEIAQERKSTDNETEKTKSTVKG